MTDEIIFSAPPPLPEAMRRLIAARANEVRDADRLSILDQLSVPKTVDDLEMQLVAKDCRMFHSMEGQPRAYMEVPTGVPEWPMVRWVYVVFAVGVAGKTQRQAEPMICEYMWKAMVALRKEFESLYPDVDPCIVWRRHLELDHMPARKKGPCFEHQESRCTKCIRDRLTRVTMRFAIPGLDLQGRDQPFKRDSVDINMISGSEA